MEIKNKVALITGGTHGIGAKTALKLVSEGVKVSLVARNADNADIKKEIENIGGTLLYRLTRSSGAHELFNHLGRAGILVRHFAEDSTWLRWGLPATKAAWQRLNTVLSAYPKA